MNNLFEDKPKRQHPLNILLGMIKALKDVIVPVIIFVLLNLNEFDTTLLFFGLLALALFLIYRLIVNIFVWKNNTYLFSSDHIKLVEGRFISNERTVALQRIQSFKQDTSFFHKIFHLTSLTMITGTENIKFDMITRQELNRITTILNAVEEQQVSTTNELIHTESEQVLVREHYEISFKEIVFISLTSMYFLAIVPVLITIYSKLKAVIDLDKYASDFYQFATQSIFIALFIIILILVIAIGIGIIVTFLRFGKYKVSSDNKQIYISKGILNTTNYTIPRDKINGVTIRKGLIRRIFKIVKVKLITLGDAMDQLSGAETDVLFPFISEQKLRKLLPEIVQDYPIKRGVNRLPKKALFVELIYTFILLSIVECVVLYYWPTYWFIPLLVLILSFLLASLEVVQGHYVHDENYIQLQTGVLSAETFVSHLVRINELTVKQSFLQRIFGLATLTISTRAKPQHIVTIKNLPKDVAFNYYHWYANGILEEKRK